MNDATVSPEQAIEATRRWLRDVVVGLNLCPFAAAPLRQDRIRYQVSEAQTHEQLLEDLIEELLLLEGSQPDAVATTLLIIPYALTDFIEYNDFLDLADAALAAAGLEGVLQIASFHPDYRFADSEPEAVANSTNRSPYPVLHLLREDDISRAVESHPDVDSIPRNNIKRLEELGAERVKALLQRIR